MELLREAKDKGLGLLGIKSMVDRAWSKEEHKVREEPFYDPECYQL